MLLQLRLAWRNIFRNPRRTLLAGIAVGIGLGAMITADALWIGMKETMIRAATAPLLGEVQITTPEYRKKYSIDRTMSPNQLPDISAFDEVRSHVRRVRIEGMIASAANLSPVAAYGIEAVQEQGFSRIHEVLSQGEFLKKTGENEILIGEKLADLLEVELGDRLVLTGAQAESGELAQGLFLVSGIFRFGERYLDGGAVFVHLADAQELFNLKGRIHEAAVKFNAITESGNRSLPFWAAVEKSPLLAQHWMEFIPGLGAIVEMSSMSSLILAICLFGVISLGVINTLFMSLYERLFEFGVLRAIGTRPRNLAAMIILEAAAMAIVSIPIGLLLGAGFSGYFSKYGIDFTGTEFSGVTLNDPIYFRMEPTQFTLFPLVTFLLTIIAALYPAWKAARISPSQAMRKSL